MAKNKKASQRCFWEVQAVMDAAAEKLSRADYEDFLREIATEASARIEGLDADDAHE